MIDDIKSAIESANTIALAGLNAGREIAERESVAKIKMLTDALQTLLDEIECLDDISVSRDTETYKAQACWDYALENAYAALKKAKG